MTESAPSLLPDLTRWFSPSTKEFESLLEALPFAALLVEPRSMHILLANLKTAELTAYTRAELSGLDIKALFADWNPEAWEAPQPALDSLPKSTFSCRKCLQELTRRDQTRLPVRLSFSPIPLKDELWLVTVEPAFDWGVGAEGQGAAGQFWQALIALTSAQQLDDQDAAIRLALESARTLCNADTLAVYKAQSDSPCMHLLIGLNTSDLLPEQISAHDLIQQRKPYLWTVGSRTLTAMDRVARLARWSYIASAPIGEPDACVGLVVMAGTSLPWHENILPVAQLLANVVTAIFQTHLRWIEAQAQLRAHQTLHAIDVSLENQILEGLLVLDEDLRIVRMNHAAEALLGYTNLEVAGQPIERVLIGPENLLSLLEDIKRQRTSHHLGCVPVFRRYGDAFPALVRIFPVGDEKTAEATAEATPETAAVADARAYAGAILILLQNMTEQEKLRVMAETLGERALAGEAIAVFAHEARNKINDISSGLQLMLRVLPDNVWDKERIALMVQECDRLAEMIKTMREYTRNLEYKLEKLDLAVLLRRLLDRLSPRAASANIRCSLHIESGCPPIMGNAYALEQVFTNLVNNAIQAMQPIGGGVLALNLRTIAAPDGRRYLEASVADTGPGIPKDEFNRLFQPFFTTKTNGTGLGLSIVKRIVTHHGGTILAHSLPGATVFRIQFPIPETETHD